MSYNQSVRVTDNKTILQLTILFLHFSYKKQAWRERFEDRTDKATLGLQLETC